MLLRNYDKLCAFSTLTHLYDASGNMGTTQYDVINNIYPKATGGNILGLFTQARSAPGLPMTKFTNGLNGLGDITYHDCNLIVGTNNTPVTYDDYTMSPISTNDIKNIAHTYEFHEDENTGEIISTYKKTFTAFNDITIKEIGVIQGVQNSSSSYQYVLVYREVLETPIEVPAAANVMITLTKRISPNSNQPADYVATASVE